MALAHTLGFPRIGADRELKKALEAYWKGDLDQDALNSVGRQLRATHWQLQKDAGIDLLPVGDFVRPGTDSLPDLRRDPRAFRQRQG
jgi:5-methyltetrahydropteroyltriglutamate--homocysteine methyltransferase